MTFTIMWKRFGEVLFDGALVLPLLAQHTLIRVYEHPRRCFVALT